MWRRVIAVWLLLMVWPIPLRAIEGTFQGQVVSPPADQPALHGWIYVQGHNHMLRRVEVSHAEIVFSSETHVSQKHKCNSECISPGQEIRVTAEQDHSGEWRAKRVEILKLGLNKT